MGGGVKGRISIVIADDHLMVRRSLARSLNRLPDVRILGEAADGQQALSEVIRSRPTIALLDLAMPATDPLDLIPQLAVLTLVVVVTADERPWRAAAVVQSGARGYVVKRSSIERLGIAIREVAAGGIYIDEVISKDLLACLVLPGAPALTDREVVIVRKVACGLDDAAISSELKISPATVRTHVGNAMAKFSAHSRLELVLRAFRSGLLGADDLLAAL